ncbi:MAG: response regulator [Candidatus Omnitrophica bacterium]|nr:response regulator [Candidatus Omnitrophota bacterium]
MASPQPKILVVDDEDVIRDVLSKYLKRYGYFVDTAEDGNIALKKLKETPGYNLIITDLMMPGVDGLEVLRSIKKTNPYIEVIVLTGYYTIENAVQAIRVGAFDFICKPCDFTQLVGIVKQCLEEQKLKMDFAKLTEIQSFFEITKIINTTSLDLDSFLAKILDFAIEITSAKKGCMLLGDKKDGREVPRCFRDFDTEESLKTDGLHFEEIDSWKPVLDIPLESAGERFGTIKVSAKKMGEEFNERERMLVSVLAGQAAVAIKKSNLYETLKLNIVQLNHTIEKLNQTNVQLIQAEKFAALGRFSTGIAHEVKNPLAILMGGIEYMQLKLDKADPDVAVALDKMKSAIVRANLILMNLLKFARPSEMKIEEYNPEQIVDETLSLLEYRAPLNNIKISKEFSQDKLNVNVDKSQIEQVLFNLMINAQEAMPKGGNIIVRISRAKAADISDKGVCLIEVIDQGEGIAPQDLQKIFEPFFTTKREKKGTGLGLSLSKTIIENHNGKMTIESQSGQGTTVRILLPLLK